MHCGLVGSALTMFRRFGPALLLLAAATMVGTAPLQEVEATDAGALMLQDSDGDFLPDSVEWALMTSSSSADTDGDTVPDFIEVVQRGLPRHESPPLPLDQEMRIVITGPQSGAPDNFSWLHVLLRFVGPADNLTAFSIVLQLAALPGVQIPLDLTLFPGAELRERVTSQQGRWVHLAVPFAPTDFLALLSPCSVRADATVGGRIVSSTVNLLEVQDTVCSIVPFGSRHVLQSIAPVAAIGEGMTNRVCLLDLAEVGSGPGGTIYEVVDAYCDDCNEMECGPGCAQSIGWIITLPGGLDGVVVGK